MEDDGTDEVGVSDGELLRDQAAHRGAHDVYPLDVELPHQGSGDIGEEPCRVWASRPLGLADTRVWSAQAV
jgi:hypothetical protein